MVDQRTDAIITLRKASRYTVLAPGDEAYEELRPAYAAAGEPAGIVRPRSAEEVSELVRFASAAGLPVSVRSGGHGAAAFANPGGLVIDLGELAAIEADADGLVRIGGGATWGAVADRLAAAGLGLTSGDTRSVGVGGLTLGGGIGWLVRKHGLALDSLVAAQVVLADGRIVDASAAEHADLFWALRGGGGNFGVVTRFTFQAHSLPGVVFGTFAFALESLPAVLRGWRDVLRQAPEELTVTLMAMPAFGEAPPSVQLLGCWAGTDVEAAEAAMAPLQALPGLLSAEVAPASYPDLLEDPPPPPPGPVTMVDANGFVRDLSDELLDEVVTVHGRIAAPVLMLRSLGGAFGRIPADATAFAHRDAEALLILIAILPPDAEPATVQETRRLWEPIAPHVAGAYGNFSMTA
ncbi:MAG TPA: FAD-binding oxidoreductase, partial [Naasia sp.]